MYTVEMLGSGSWSVFDEFGTDLTGPTSRAEAVRYRAELLAMTAIKKKSLLVVFPARGWDRCEVKRLADWVADEGSPRARRALFAACAARSETGWTAAKVAVPLARAGRRRARVEELDYLVRAGVAVGPTFDASAWAVVHAASGKLVHRFQTRARALWFGFLVGGLTGDDPAGRELVARALIAVGEGVVARG